MPQFLKCQFLMPQFLNAAGENIKKHPTLSRDRKIALRSEDDYPHNLWRSRIKAKFIKVCMTQHNPNIDNPTALLAVSTPPDNSSLALVQTIAEAADDRKAEDILLLGVAEISYLTDYFIIATGFSRAQVRAICNSIENAVEEQYQRLPNRIEGKTEGSWIVLDYGDAIAHILLPEEREYYNLEAFWGHAERIDWQCDRVAGE